MATYAELATIRQDPLWNDLLDKIVVATTIKATEVIDSATPAATLLEWAKQAIAKPLNAANDIAFYVVAANQAATLAQILSASDAAIQTNIDTAIDAIYGA